MNCSAILNSGGLILTCYRELELMQPSCRLAPPEVVQCLFCIILVIHCTTLWSVLLCVYKYNWLTLTCIRLCVLPVTSVIFLVHAGQFGWSPVHWNLILTTCDQTLFQHPKQKIGSELSTWIKQNACNVTEALVTSWVGVSTLIMMDR